MKGSFVSISSLLASTIDVLLEVGLRAPSGWLLLSRLTALPPPLSDI
jgi:hypothetical protein